MAVDKTEPPIKVIITVAGLSLGILVAMRVFFVSYFNNAYEARSREQIEAMLHGASYVWTAGRLSREEGPRLGRLPGAIAEVASGRRAASISPTLSNDLAPLQGWTLAPREVPSPATPVLDHVSPVPAPVALAGPAAVPVAAAPGTH